MSVYVRKGQGKATEEGCLFLLEVVGIPQILDF